MKKLMIAAGLVLLPVAAPAERSPEAELLQALGEVERTWRDLGVSEELLRNAQEQLIKNHCLERELEKLGR